MNTTFDPAVPVADIYVDSDFNCRGQFTLQSVKDLAESIGRVGLISPVSLQPWDQDGYTYRLIVGFRRFMAVTYFLKWTTIAANICLGLSDRDARILNFTENLERKDLNILEEALRLIGLYPIKTPIRQMAREVKKDTRWVYIRRWLAAAPEDIQQKAASGLLSQANLERLAGLKSLGEQLFVADQISEARRRGKGKFLPGLDKRYKRRGVRSRAEINQLVERMLAAGLDGLPTRVAAWCAGYVSDEELAESVVKVVPTWTASAHLPMEEDDDD